MYFFVEKLFLAKLLLSGQNTVTFFSSQFFLHRVDAPVVATVPVVAIFIIIYFQSLCFHVVVLILR